MDPSHSVRPRLHKSLLCLMAFILSFWSTLPKAHAETKGPTTSHAAEGLLGFSNLIVRLEGEDKIGMAGSDFRIYIIEELRSAGLNVVGAESLVFGKDNSDKAEFLLGGTIRELDCMPRRDVMHCRIGIEWQVLDVRRDQVVYKVMIRDARYWVTPAERKALPKQLVLGALSRLSHRPGFRQALRRKKVEPSPSYAALNYRECDQESVAMPEASEQVLAATVLVRSGKAFGSGFFLSSDGLVLTAAHVINSPDIELQLPDGRVLKAHVLRVHPKKDVALLRTRVDESQPCLALALEPQKPGSDIYAIGSPASQELSFSLTRGIISGLRILDGAKFLQTDASISPGNSGGPLIDNQGRATGIVSWKLAHDAIEGVAFGIPIAVALDALGLHGAEKTDSKLLNAKAIVGTAAFGQPSAKLVVDDSDPIPNLDPNAKRAQGPRTGSQPNQTRDSTHHTTSAAAQVLRWTGVVTGIAGAVVVIASTSSFDRDSMMQEDIDRLRLQNDLGWVGLAVGSGLFGLSFILPSETESTTPQAKRKPATRATLAIRPDASVRLGVTF